MKKILFVMASAFFVNALSAQMSEKTVEVGGAPMYPSKNIVANAVNSADHTTLVAALKQADLVTSLSNAGPFTVFAPTNEAFNKLPAGTVDGLMKDDKKADLQNILQYHVAVSAMKAESFTDGQTLGMVNGDNITISVKDGKVTLNGTAQIIASIPASNGIIHVIDGVLLPPAKK